jgi:hypothetical protein
MAANALAWLPLCCLLAATEEPTQATPKVLTPVEFRAAFTRAQVRSYMFDSEMKKVLIFRPERLKRKVYGYVSVDELTRMQDMRLAERVLPLRMVIGVGSFPYRKQVEEVRRALSLKSLEEARREVVFVGFNIERRRVGPDGKPLDKWENIDVLETARKVARASGKRFVAEDPSRRAVLIPGLAMRLPEQFRLTRRYPRPEVELPHLSETLQAMVGHDPTSDAIPEYCLLRFIDATVEPGQTYQYRVQVRMVDPECKNEKQTAGTLLVSAWVQLPETVTVPPDFAFYAVDQKELDPKHFPGAKAPADDEVSVQLHRWLDLYNAPDVRDPQPVGDWAIADRVLFHAGEYIGGTHTVELPIWNWFDERFVLARDPENPEPKRVPVAFTEESEVAPLLVSFSGGSIESNGVTERVPRELLVLMPSGRLAVRNSAADTRDRNRCKQYHDWRSLVDTIKSGVARAR